MFQIYIKIIEFNLDVISEIVRNLIVMILKTFGCDENESNITPKTIKNAITFGHLTAFMQFPQFFKKIP